MNLPNVPKTATTTRVSWIQDLANFLFAPNPVIKDIAEWRKAQLTLILTVVLTLTNTISLFFVAQNGINATFYIQIALTLVTFLAYLLSRGPRFILGSTILIASLSISGFANVLTGSDNPTDALYTTLPAALIIGSALLPVWANVFLFIGNMIGITILPMATSSFNFSDAGNASSVIVTGGVLLIVVQIVRNNIERERVAEVQAINKELREIGANLEQRVADRTKALQTSGEVTRRLAAVTNIRQLAVEVVEQVKSAFNYYHAHIYFMDEDSGDLIMAGGTGEAGAVMLANGHKIKKGRGLVGRAAESNAPVLVPDVSQEEGWLPNPLLPDTKSEVSIPISSGNLVLGVLDVQQNVVNGLAEDDVVLLQSIAGQVAISLKNVRTFEESRTKAEVESMINLIGQKIQRAGSVEETLQTAIRELSTALGASRVKAAINMTPQSDTKSVSNN